MKKATLWWQLTQTAIRHMPGFPSLSKRFSLVEMIATGIVYVKDTRTNTYQPFISGKGKYCKYDKEKGILVEI